MNFVEIIESIKTRADFVSFVHELSKDYRANPKEWSNNDLGLYLDALAAWVEDIDGYYLNQGQTVPERPDWKILADMMMAAKFYE